MAENPSISDQVKSAPRKLQPDAVTPIKDAPRNVHPSKLQACSSVSRRSVNLKEAAEASTSTKILERNVERSRTPRRNPVLFNGQREKRPSHSFALLKFASVQ